MDRAEVVKGLEQLVSRAGDSALLYAYTDALRAAIAYMQPPPTTEVEAARNMVLTWYSTADAEVFAKHHDEQALYGGASREFHERAASFLRIAGDALDREPGYQARLVDAAALHLADEQSVRNMERRIAALEAAQRGAVEIE